MSLIKVVSGNPDPFASFEEKKSDEYGLKIGGKIGTEWFNGGTISNGCVFMKRREYVVSNRLFVRGEQDTKIHKDLAKRGDNDMNLLNLDWENVNHVEKFCRLISNGISEDTYRLNVRATDTLSVKLRTKKVDEYRKFMAAKPMLEKAKKIQGIDLMPTNAIPEDEDELQLQIKIKDRPKIEEAEEILIDFVKKTNDWNYIHNAANVDAVDNGLLGCRVWTDKNNGVMLAYVDPENYIHSYINRNDFADKYYEGVVDTITLSDLKRESDFDDMQLRKIAKTYSVKNGATFGFNFDKCSMDSIIDYQIDVLRFAWKTSKQITFKQKVRKGEVVKTSRKSDTFQAPDREDVKMISKKLDTWFEGNYIPGANAIYGYQECENLARDTMNKALSPFVFRATNIYKNQPQSFLTKIKPIARRMQDALLKLQLLIQELRPDTIVINTNQLAEIKTGKGTQGEKWQGALDIFQVKGIILEQTIDMGEMGKDKSAPVRSQASAQGTAIIPVMNALAYYYNQIRDITGVNEARDGSMAPDALVGVNQMAQLASNTATKHIVDASVDFNLKVCELISTRLHGIFKHKEADHLRKIYEAAVGKHFMDAVEVLADRHLHEFGFVFEMLPTKEELAKFERYLTICIQDSSIDGEVVMEAERIAKTNIKLAVDYLFFERKKKMKQRQENEMALSANKSQNDAAAAASKAQSDTQSYGQKKQIDLGYAGQLAQIEIQKAQALQQIAQPVADQEFKQEVFLAQIQKSSDLNVKRYLEDRKDDRTKLQATQQSKLKKQSQVNGEPIDFEENWDLENLVEN